MTELIQNYPFLSGLVAINWVIALRLLLGLWILKIHRETSKSKRLLWSVLVFFPIFGPLCYGALFKIPPPHEDGGAKVNKNAFYGGPYR